MGTKGIYQPHNCLTCGENNPANFWNRQKTRCKVCQGKINEEKRLERRRIAVDYKGGKCERCGYDKYTGALEFHHRDPTQKDPNALKNRGLKALLKEVEKCDLLCANCHREEHARIEGRIDGE
jgi:5-methylcytosine-specific restriction endonuclease McrA